MWFLDCIFTNFKLLHIMKMKKQPLNNFKKYNCIAIYFLERSYYVSLRQNIPCNDWRCNKRFNCSFVSLLTIILRKEEIPWPQKAISNFSIRRSSSRWRIKQNGFNDTIWENLVKSGCFILIPVSWLCFTMQLFGLAVQLCKSIF